MGPGVQVATAVKPGSLVIPRTASKTASYVTNITRAVRSRLSVNGAVVVHNSLPTGVLLSKVVVLVTPFNATPIFGEADCPTAYPNGSILVPPNKPNDDEPLGLVACMFSVPVSHTMLL